MCFKQGWEKKEEYLSHCVRRHVKSVKISTSALFAQKTPVSYKIHDKTLLATIFPQKTIYSDF